MTKKSRLVSQAMLICILAIALPTRAAAQDAGAAEPAAEPTCAVNPAVARQAGAVPTVEWFTPNPAALGDRLKVCVPDFDAWRKEQPNHKLDDIVLYLDDVPITGSKPNESSPNVLLFDLHNSKDFRAAWKSIAGRPGGYTRDVGLKIGFPGELRWPSKANGAAQIIPPYWFWGCVIFIILLLAGFIYLAAETNILRDVGPDPGSNQSKTLSLARVQMAIWFFVVIASFLLIYSITGDTTVSATALTLTGISMGTGLAATVVDSNKQAATKATLDSLTAERGTILARIQELRQQAATAALAAPLKDELDQKTARLAAINNQLNDAQRTLAPQPSQGIALDLLTDANGVSLYRFQMLAWTLVLVVVFLWHVYTQLAMPDLDTTLLALMGISNGTYIGFKVPEKQA